MPAKSKSQFRFFEAAAHNPAFAKKAGIKPGVAKEFADATANPKALPEKVKARPRGRQGKR